MRRKGSHRRTSTLSEAEGAFTSQDEALLRQFAAHVAVALENARLFESERHYVDTLETLAEIGREMSSILDLDALLTRIASLTAADRLSHLRHPAPRGRQQRTGDEAGGPLRQGRRIQTCGSATAW